MRRWIVLFVIIAVVLIADQGSKWLVLQNLMAGETYRPIPALSPMFQITRSENSGSAFGFLPQASEIFLLIAIVVVIAMVVFYRRIPDHATLTQVAIALVCGGALGNALDRVQHGAVIDFIHYQIPGLISNVSNLADHAIVLGVILIFYESWRSERSKQILLESEEAGNPQ
jgi:signal peptidase II